MQFFMISHLFYIKVSLDIKMGLCFLEKNCLRISEISFHPSFKTKLLFPVCHGIPCIVDNLSIDSDYYSISMS